MILTHLPIWAEDAEIHGVVITAMDVTSLSAAMRGKDGEVGMAEQEKREKVIKGLECCKIPFTKCYDGGCPYFENDGCKARLKGDALALLKEYDDALKLMVYQYCTMKPLTVNDKVFHNKFMCAGETAFRLLGLENGQSTEGVWERWFPND